MMVNKAFGLTSLLFLLLFNAVTALGQNSDTDKQEALIKNAEAYLRTEPIKSHAYLDSLVLNFTSPLDSSQREVMQKL